MSRININPDTNTVKVSCVCPMCKHTNIVEVSILAYTAWRKGEYIQVAMPNLSAGDRELLISGICKTCWDKLFNISQEDDDE